MYIDKIKSAYPTALLILALILGSLYTTSLIVEGGVMMAPVIIVSIGGLLSIALMMQEYKIGIYLTFFIAVFMAFANRLTDMQVPYGIATDALAGITFLLMLFSQKQKTDWKQLRSSITYFYIAIVVYQLLQVFNPNAVSFTGWVVAFRANASFLLFFAFYHLFQSFEELKKFTNVWLILATVVAIYGVWQEIFGLTAREYNWVYSDPGRVGLYFIWNHLRVFSFLNDPAVFGLFMAFSALCAFVLMLGPVSMFHRVIYGGASLLMLVSMSFSGTRTATAMIAVGLAFYVLITLKSKKTFIFMIIGGMGIVILLFGPFYSGTVIRLRSTFKASEDASMNVRDYKRVSFQWYIRENPFGGGLNTTGQMAQRYSPGHYLTSIPDTDSGYLTIALETGWVGLLLWMGLFLATIFKGINAYFTIRDPMSRTYTLAYLVPFLALSVAHYTQDAMFQKPAYLIIIAAYAAMLKLPTYEKKHQITP